MTKKENAQSVVQTRLSDDLEMITTVDLANLEIPGPPKKDVYHFVYASQLYGSLFAIYGRFKIDKQPGSCNVTAIDLDLFNYQGIFNIGFTEPAICFQKGNVFYVVFGVRAQSPLRSVPVLLPPVNIQVGSTTPVRLKFCRFLYRTTEFSNVDNTTVDNYGRLKNPLPDGNFFDTEFYSRSGADNFINMPRPGLTDESLQDIKKHILDGTLGADSDKRVASPRCTQSEVNLIYR